MTIIKHGSPKERIHFVCPDCGCEWKARIGEVRIGLIATKMNCPCCGFDTSTDFPCNDDNDDLVEVSSNDAQ